MNGRISLNHFKVYSIEKNESLKTAESEDLKLRRGMHNEKPFFWENLAMHPSHFSCIILIH